MLTLSRPSLSGGAPTRARGCSGLAVRDASTPLRVLQGSLLASLKPTDVVWVPVVNILTMYGTSELHICRRILHIHDLIAACLQLVL